MNIFFKVGEKIFKLIAVFLILLALLIEYISKIQGLISKKSDYSNGNKIKSSIYPRLKLFSF